MPWSRDLRRLLPPLHLDDDCLFFGMFSKYMVRSRFLSLDLVLFPGVLLTLSVLGPSFLTVYLQPTHKRSILMGVGSGSYFITMYSCIIFTWLRLVSSALGMDSLQSKMVPLRLELLFFPFVGSLEISSSILFPARFLYKTYIFCSYTLS